MAPSKRPLVDKFGTTWLGDPEGPDFSIEIADDYIGFSMPSGDITVPWSDIVDMDVVIPTASWRLAKTSHWLLSTMDVLQAAGSGGMPTPTMNDGHKDIEVRITRRDGTEVKGWGRKHQPLGYPEPEAEAAIAVLRGRIGTGRRDVGPPS
jgi:hypothetical protein